jgi:hypothetical protein
MIQNVSSKLGIGCCATTVDSHIEKAAQHFSEQISNKVKNSHSSILTFDNMSKAGMIWCNTLTYVVRASRMHVENASKFEVHTNTAIITNALVSKSLQTTERLSDLLFSFDTIRQNILEPDYNEILLMHKTRQTK